jgi:hypothetical protein
VHNAPAGYWTVATHCHAPSSAISAWRTSLAAGLFEAAVQAHADGTPVLFAIYDIAARGPLADGLDAPAAYGGALVINAERGPRARASLCLSRADGTNTDAGGGDPIRAARSLFGALACAGTRQLHLPSGASSTLIIEVCA